MIGVRSVGDNVAQLCSLKKNQNIYYKKFSFLTAS